MWQSQEEAPLAKAGCPLLLPSLHPTQSWALAHHRGKKWDILPGRSGPQEMHNCEVVPANRSQQAGGRRQRGGRVSQQPQLWPEFWGAPQTWAGGEPQVPTAGPPFK